MSQQVVKSKSGENTGLGQAISKQRFRGQNQNRNPEDQNIIQTGTKYKGLDFALRGYLI